MSAKMKKSNATIKSTLSENILPKRVATASKEFRGITNEGEFSYNFRKFCIECNTTVIPNVKIVSPDDLRGLNTVSCSNFSKLSESSSGNKPQTEQKEALVLIPEILAVQDDATTAIVEVIFRQFRVDRNLLVALTKTLKIGTFLRTVKLEFCYLTSKEIIALSVILRIVDTITEVSVDGNPNKFQNFHLLLKDSKLLNLSLRFCGIDANGARKIAERINAFGTEMGLMRLNLASNFLGDDGAAHIAKSLRINRSLLILNLADNQITDSGCEKIVEPLQSFALNETEVRMRRKRVFTYLKRKQELMDVVTTSKSKITMSHSHSTNSRKVSKDSLLRKKAEQEGKKDKMGLKHAGSTTSSRTVGSIQSKSQSSRSELERMNYAISEGVLPPDLHPLVKNAIVINREWYCIGNNRLMSLNLAYNKITQVGLRMLIEMLNYQSSTFVLPESGLLKITLEGNAAPNCCSEMNEILDLINHKNEFMPGGSMSSKHRSSVASSQ